MSKQDDPLAGGGGMMALAERVRSQDALIAQLRMSEARHRALAASATQLSWMMDAQGNVKEECPSWLAFTGQTSAEMRDQGWLDAIHPDERPQVADGWRAAMATGGEYHEEWRLRRADGEYRLMQAWGGVVRDASGAICEWFGCCNDITERHQAEQERLMLLDVVSHELKSPLTSIKLAASMLHRHATEPPTPDLLARLSDGIARMQHLLDDLQDAAQTTYSGLALEFAPVDLAALCRHIAEEHGQAAERTIALDLPQHRLLAELDANRIAQVVANLVVNALKYTPPAAEIRLSVQRGKRQARIVVQDAGPGISPAALPHLFERFYRAPDAPLTPGATSGLGLGLYICRMLTHAHHGEITVQSALGQGTAFTVTLPIKHPVD